MDIQKEREAFEEWCVKDDEFCIHRYDGSYEYSDDYTQCAWLAWQAAKAQAVPEGFALVSQKDLLELTIAINAVDLATHTESKTNEVREMWQQVAIKLMALGTTQEPK